MMLNLADPACRGRIKALLSTKPFAEQPSAVVVGNSINALGVVRSLGREKIKVIWVTSNPNSFVLTSRFADQIIVSSDIYYKNFIPALEELGALFVNRPVLFLTHDFQVKQVGVYQKMLSTLYRFQFPSSETVENLLSKTHFFDLAQEHGVEVPPTHSIVDSNGLRSYVSSCCDDESYVVKPFEKDDVFENYFGKALRVKGQEEWRSFLPIFEKIGCPILIQKWISGGDDHILFCLVVFDDRSNCILSFCGRKLRQYKPEIGSTASAEMYESQDMQNIAIRFFEKIQFTGMGSMEFKCCQKTGCLYAIEPTVGRTNLQSEVSTVNGYNLAAVYYYSVIGALEKQQSIIDKANTSRKNKVWMRFQADLKSAWFHYQKRHITLGQWLRTYFRHISFAVFRMNDPTPFLKLVLQGILNAFYLGFTRMKKGI